MRLGPRPKPWGAKGFLAREGRELDQLPAQIEQLEAEQVRLAVQLQDPELYRSNPDALPKIEAESNALEAKIRAAYARWEELEAKRCALEEGAAVPMCGGSSGLRATGFEKGVSHSRVFEP